MNIDEIPLPPGSLEFERHDSDSKSSIIVTALYGDRSLAELCEFYEGYFAKEGWTNNLSGESMKTKTPGRILDFNKGRSNVHVCVLEVKGKRHLHVSYREYPYTHEEFENQVRVTATPDALALVDLVKQTYLALDSYRDSGTFVRHRKGQIFSSAVFRTLTDVQRDLYFEFRHVDPTPFKTAHTLSLVGGVAQTMSNFDKEPCTADDVSLAIAALFGVTSRISGNIPELLLGLEEGALFYLGNLRKIENERLSDGTGCARLSGQDFGGTAHTLWIGETDLLIRRIERRDGPDDWDMTTYFPEPNAPIAPEEMVFKPPVAR